MELQWLAGELLNVVVANSDVLFVFAIYFNCFTGNNPMMQVYWEMHMGIRLFKYKI